MRPHLFICSLPLHLLPAVAAAVATVVWELLTHDRPFKGLLEGDLVVGVCDRGLRPVFPPGCPAHYVALAQQCWSDDPSHRPSAAEVRAGLTGGVVVVSVHAFA